MFIAQKMIFIALVLGTPFIYCGQPQQHITSKRSMIIVTPPEPDLLGSFAPISYPESAAAPTQPHTRNTPKRNGSTSALDDDRAGSVAEGQNGNLEADHHAHGSQYRSAVTPSKTITKRAQTKLQKSSGEQRERRSTGEAGKDVHSGAQSLASGIYLTPSTAAQPVPAIVLDGHQNNPQISRAGKSAGDKQTEEQREETNVSPVVMFMTLNTPPDELALESVKVKVKKFLQNPSTLQAMAQQLNKTPLQLTQAYWVAAYLKNKRKDQSIVSEHEAMAIWNTELNPQPQQQVPQPTAASQTAAAPAQTPAEAPKGCCTVQ